MARRESPEINAGSMADIAFLLLIFFLVTTTMDVDSGIARKLPPMPDDETIIDDADINKRNIFIVMVNANDQLLVNDELLDISDLKEKAKKFVNNNGRVATLSVSPDKAVISLQNDRGTSYDLYIQVQNELAAAYNELRDAKSMSDYGTKYDNLVDDKQKEVRKAYPMRLSEAEPKKQ